MFKICGMIASRVLVAVLSIALAACSPSAYETISAEELQVAEDTALRIFSSRYINQPEILSEEYDGETNIYTITVRSKFGETYEIAVDMTQKDEVGSYYNSIKMTQTDAGKSSVDIEQLIELLNNRDAEGIKAEFSAQALYEAENIDEEIEAVLEHISNKIISCDNKGSSKKWSNETGFIIVQTKYDLSMENGEKFFILLAERFRDTDDTDDVGLYMMLIKENTIEDTEDITNIYVDRDDLRAGVFWGDLLPGM